MRNMLSTQNPKESTVPFLRVASGIYFVFIHSKCLCTNTLLCIFILVGCFVISRHVCIPLCLDSWHGCKCSLRLPFPSDYHLGQDLESSLLGQSNHHICRICVIPRRFHPQSYCQRFHGLYNVKMLPRCSQTTHVDTSQGQ